MTVTSVGENIWVFEQRTLTGSGSFSLSICLDSCLDGTKFVFPSVLTLIETIYPKICSRAQPKSAKSPLPVDVRRSKTSLLKLPIFRQLKASRPIAERQIEHTGSRLFPFFSFLFPFCLSFCLSFFFYSSTSKEPKDDETLLGLESFDSVFRLQYLNPRIPKRTNPPLGPSSRTRRNSFCSQIRRL